MSENDESTTDMPESSRTSSTSGDSQDIQGLLKTINALRADNKKLENQLKIQRTADASSKTELEKLTDRLTNAEKELEKTRMEALKLDIAAEKGLSKAQAKRLQGTTKEELEADAEDMREAFGIKDKLQGSEMDAESTPQDRPARKVRPKEQLNSGAQVPKPESETQDATKIADAVMKGVRGF